MRIRCSHCGERFAIADIPARLGPSAPARPMKVRCRACRGVIEVGEGASTVEPLSGGAAGQLGAATGLPPRSDGSALIEIRQLAARTLAAHANPREPSARVAIQALLGSSRLATLMPMPPPMQPSMPSWMVLLVVASVSILVGTATFGALLYKYAGETRVAVRPVGTLLAQASAAPLPPVLVVSPRLPAADGPTAPPGPQGAPLSSPSSAPLAAPGSPVVAAPQSPGSVKTPALLPAPAPPTVAVRQHHRGGGSRRHARLRTGSKGGHATARVVATSPRSHKTRTLDDDDLDRLLESTRFATHGR